MIEQRSLAHLPTRRRRDANETGNDPHNRDTIEARGGRFNEATAFAAECVGRSALWFIRGNRQAMVSRVPLGGLRPAAAR
jgi:hypothetical protein